MNLRHSQRGIGLLEVLITILIVGVGFLAIARMQIGSLKFSQSAYFQSQAYLLASEMVERIRLNPDGVDAGEYDSMSTTSGSSANTLACSASGCSASEQAALDLAVWSQAINPASTGVIPALPSSASIAAAGSVTRLDNDRFVVSVAWSETIDGVETEESIQISFVPTSI